MLKTIEIFLMGDFNVKEINWLEEEAVGSIESFPFRFHECIKDSFLYLHIFMPTRFRGEQESTLDLVFIKEEDDVKNIEVIQPLGKSDHGVIVCNLICEWTPKILVRPPRQDLNARVTPILRPLCLHV